MSREDTTAMRRRQILKAAGTVAAVGFGGVGTASAKNGRGNSHGGRRGGNAGNERGGGPPGTSEPEDRTIEWDEQRGSENAELDCFQSQTGIWYWILTPGGPEEFTEVGELKVKFEDEDEYASFEGEQKGKGAYHFVVEREGGGEIESAKIDVTGGGRNAALTISDSECVGEVYWQIDFGTGDSPPEPPMYGDDDFDGDLIMAAIGSSDGVLYNPSCDLGRDYIDITTDEGNFDFDDEDNPTEVTIEFEITDDESRDLHLAAFTTPPHDIDDDKLDGSSCPIGETQLNVEEQELFEPFASEEFDPGEEGSLTIDLPTPDSA